MQQAGGVTFNSSALVKPHILNMELQTGSDSEMADRMLQYHVELYIEELSMQYDSLIDDNPDVQKRISKGEQRGKIQGLQEVALLAVKGDYPDLAELAQERIERIQKLESLRELIRLIYKAPDEKTVRWLLETI